MGSSRRINSKRKKSFSLREKVPDRADEGMESLNKVNIVSMQVGKAFFKG